MEELEDQTERLKETLEAVEEKNEEKERWTLHVAVSTAIIAVLAAIAGMLGNHHANEGVLEQIKASDSWNYYQAKGIKSEIANATAQVLAGLGKPLPQENADKLARYEKERADIKTTAEEATKESEEHMTRHVTFSRSVTIFQIAVALSAVAILTRRKLIWYLSMALAASACVFLVMGFL